MSSGRFLVESSGKVAIIRIDDAPTRNSISMAMADELRDHLRACGKTARAIVLTGSGQAFCSGANLGSLTPDDFEGRDAGAALEAHINPLMQAVRDLHVPLVTAVRGAAAGVGASLALAGDIIVAGRSAYFLQAFCHIGLLPDGGSPWLLTKAIGRVRAMELMMLGEKLHAERAYEWGMVTRLVPDEEVQSEALALARRLADGPTVALGLIRAAGWAAAESTFTQELELERQLQRQAGAHPVFKEGVMAFLQKRPASFGD